MSIVVIYKSSTGFTEKYGKWIAEALNCDVISVKEVSDKIIAKYDTVIYGGSIHAGQISGLKKMKNILSQVADKKLIVYATGGAPAAAQAIQDITRVNFTEDELKKSPFYYFQGGLAYEKMNLPNRMLMKAFRSMLEKKKDKTEEEAGMAASLKNSYDNSDRKYIEPLITYINSL